MSNNLPEKKERPNHDFTMKDLEAIEKFKEKGMLGLHTLDPLNVERAMGLYMNGKTYRQIANTLKVDKTIIMFLSQKFNWCELRNDYLDELYAGIKTKIVESKLQSQEFLLTLTAALQKKIGKHVEMYFRTDDTAHIEKVNEKLIASYLKVVDTLHKLDAENYRGSPEDKPLVGLNGLADGITITKTGNNSVEITPKQKSGVGEKLKQFADLKRQQERANEVPKPVRDITIETENPKKESDKNEEDSN